MSRPSAIRIIPATNCRPKLKPCRKRRPKPAAKQDKARRGDVVKTTVGVVLFWPVLLFNEGDGAKANELANLKGQMNAIQQASQQKQCGFTFQQ